MEKTWTVSIVGIIVALGGLGFIAIFFAIVGHFFKRSSQKKQKKRSPKVTSFASSSVIEAPTEKKNSSFVETVNKFDEDEEIVAVIGAALAAYTSTRGNIVSIKCVKRKPNNLWRLHSAQNVWRIKRK